MLITLPPDKTFIILCDEKGDQILFDSHQHYTDENFTFEEAVKRKDLLGIIASSDNASNMLMYAFAHTAKELRCSLETGSVIRITKSKNY